MLTLFRNTMIRAGSPVACTGSIPSASVIGANTETAPAVVTRGTDTCRLSKHRSRAERTRRVHHCHSSNTMQQTVHTSTKGKQCHTSHCLNSTHMRTHARTHRSTGNDHTNSGRRYNTQTHPYTHTHPPKCVQQYAYMATNHTPTLVPLHTTPHHTTPHHTTPATARCCRTTSLPGPIAS